ncbi:MAG: Spy/CpxP family protein refolding chaperone [Proteobacteria bacterium]|nr:Spy/CpxP family protein refolding chaperone [Pseudomonadota bacterium]
MKRLLTSKVLLTASALLLLGGVAAAKRSRGGPGAAPHGRPGHPCMGLLMHAPPPVLKAKLGLDEAQIKKLEGLRAALMGKGVELRAQVQKQQLALRALLAQDLPQEAAVLDALRKVRGLRGQLHEERIKTMIKVLGLLSPPQRAKLRAACPGDGKGEGKGKGKGGCPFCGEAEGEAGDGPGCGAACGGCPQCAGGKCAGGAAGLPKGMGSGGSAAAAPGKGVNPPPHCCGSAGTMPL